MVMSSWKPLSTFTSKDDSNGASSHTWVGLRSPSDCDNFQCEREGAFWADRHATPLKYDREVLEYVRFNNGPRSCARMRPHSKGTDDQNCDFTHTGDYGQPISAICQWEEKGDILPLKFREAFLK